jgi:HEPN domain-containing protein
MATKSERPDLSEKYSTDAETWLQWADHTHAGARTLFESQNPLLWFGAAILGHQALEMYLKGALIRQGYRIGGEDIWGHNLVELATKLQGKVNSLPTRLMEDLQVFTDYFNELRYPGELVHVEGLGQEEGAILENLVQSLRPFAKG